MPDLLKVLIAALIGLMRSRESMVAENAVVRLNSLDEAVRFVNDATQMIGIDPEAAKIAPRDHLANAGAQ